MNGAPHAATPAAAAVVAVAVASPAAASPATAATVASPPPLLALGGGDSNSSTALNSPKPLPTNTNTDSEEGAQTSVEETHTPYHSEEAVQQTESEFGSFTGVPLRLTLPQPPQREASGMAPATASSSSGQVHTWRLWNSRKRPDDHTRLALPPPCLSEHPCAVAGVGHGPGGRSGGRHLLLLLLWAWPSHAGLLLLLWRGEPHAKLPTRPIRASPSTPQ